MVVRSSPTTYEEAVSSADADDWRAAMTQEYDSLMKNKVWKLVDRPKNVNVNLMAEILPDTRMSIIVYNDDQSAHKLIENKELCHKRTKHIDVRFHFIKDLVQKRDEVWPDASAGDRREQFAQSVAAARYLGREFGLSGSNANEDFNIDCIVDHCTDIFIRGGTVTYETDPEAKKKKQELFAKEHYPGMLAKLEETIAENDGYLANGKLSWGDFYIAGMFDCMKMMLQMPDLGDKCPNLKALHERVLALPKVKAWAANAPHADY
ncbi:hypothetical protein MSG28_013397 [Choristoneura fumiferana]|uniref:Uncharacterized protein n=1 Tax=Choristoneura fumiferana TaxID=7141 RepID=A0ACC0KTT5_CHOFU|nr:hypothetical protein MSG28_013397 [Choristoneura fumiferana]